MDFSIFYGDDTGCPEVPWLVSQHCAVSCIWVKATHSYRACFHFSVHLPDVLLPLLPAYLFSASEDVSGATSHAAGSREQQWSPRMSPGLWDNSCPDTDYGLVANKRRSYSFTSGMAVHTCVGQPCPVVPIPPTGIGWSGSGGGVGHQSHQEASPTLWARLKHGCSGLGAGFAVTARRWHQCPRPLQPPAWCCSGTELVSPSPLTAPSHSHLPEDHACGCAPGATGGWEQLLGHAVHQ